MSTYRIHDRDNVAVAVEDLKAGEPLDLGGVRVICRTGIPRGHKFAIRKIDAGGRIVKYGYPIGTALQDIDPGEHIHVHNLKTGLSGTLEYDYDPVDARLQAAESRSFMGFLRSDGKAGTRNEVWIIPISGCVNRTTQMLANSGCTFPENVEGIHAFPHPFGCSQLGDDHEHTRNILAGLTEHPNAGAVLLVGLGCENNQMDTFIELLKQRGSWNDRRIQWMVTQDVEDELASGRELLMRCIDYAAQFQRREIPSAKLIVGLKCGGSDGLSGLTANPLVGAFSDDLITQGGSTILTEVPEMFGAETILMNRAANKEVYGKIVSLINNFKEYFLKHNQTVYENPSPGNKKGGISTLEDKSLGCTQKSGDAPVTDVIHYGEILRTPGLNLLQGPGNDIVSVTALAAAGAQIILFTTGRGNPLGSPVPTVKIASNNDLAARKAHWIDFSAGDLVSKPGTLMETLRKDLMGVVLDHASGKRTRNEENGYREIAIFKDGVIL
ncbi:altronate dehydratase family protein [Marispirochaeta sp.]|uniref:UxaA family hydrolase n=1 Tax=Marispirochaeta sp. TaxID=2038653 RepID=UPI0029C70E7A|nr:altronate dehydratase family protein [Marispirochaeta sp.]